MVFKINVNDIVNGLIKDFADQIPQSTSKALATAIEQEQTETKNQQECENLADLKNNLNPLPKKTTIVPTTKTVKPEKKRIVISSLPSPKDEEVINRFRDKEISLQPISKQKQIKTEKPKRSTETISVGKRLTVIDDANFNPDYNVFLNKSAVNTNDIFIPDALRGRSGKYWSLNKESKNIIFVGNEEDYKIRFPYNFDFHEILNDEEKTDFGRTYQIVGIESNKPHFKNAQLKFSKPLWGSFVLGKKFNGSTQKSEKLDFTFESTIKEDQIFFDHSFSMDLPFEAKQVENLGLGGTLSAQIEPNYNFYIEEYENNIVKSDVLENTLPNIYVMLSENDSKNPNPEFARLISLDGNIQTDTKKLLTYRKKHGQLNKSRVYDLKSNPIGEYFDLFGRQYQNAVKAGVIKKLDSKYSNIGISINDISLVKQYGQKQELFPLSVNIRFSTDKTTTFAQILKDTHLSDAFTSKIINRVVSKQFELLSTEEALEEIVQPDSETAVKKTKFSKTTHRNWDLADIIGDLQAGEETLTANAIYLGEYEQALKAENRPEFKFFRSLSSEIFQSKIQTLIRDKWRNYEEIIDGNLAYSETVLYRIAKFIGNDTRTDPIQNIWIPNATNLDVLEYIDTQVKYDKRYTYVIYAYQVVLGNKYWYSDVKVDEYEHHASFRVYQEPSIRLIEVPYYTFTARIIDKPPAPPEVDFIAYKGVDNKFLLMFNNSIMEFKAQPNIIKSSDQHEFAKIREAQRLKDRQPMSFGGDDRIAQYEIYRLTEKPTSYVSFANAIRRILDTDVSKASIQKATSASAIDDIQPNKKYWYVFRSIDIHGHMSNPTFLYEAEMINEHGTIFPLVSVVDFKEQFEKEPTKNLKRFIQIIPTVLQGLIDEDKSGFIDAKTAEQVKNKVALGLAEQKVWGKTFRIRLISKNTGKRIDFDINFQHRSIKKVKAE